MQSPITTDYAVEFPTFGEIAGVSASRVWWIISFTLGKPPREHGIPCQVSKYSSQFLSMNTVTKDLTYCINPKNSRRIFHVGFCALTRLEGDDNTINLTFAGSLAPLLGTELLTEGA